jgi:nucleoid-associated protein YgaU
VLVAAPQAQNILAAAPASATTGSQPVISGGAGTKTTADSGKVPLDALTTRTVTVAAAKTTKHAAAAKTTTYRVRSGDTLSTIAECFYHRAADWQFLYHENAQTISNPDDIYAGEKLVIPATADAGVTLADYVPKHAKAVAKPAAKTTVKHTAAKGARAAAESSQAAHPRGWAA